MNKQIEVEGMAKVIFESSPIPSVWHSDAVKFAEALYNADYRKASDAAREIFEEIEKEIIAALKSNYRVKAKISARGEENCITYHIIEGKIAALRGIDDFLAELKKKHESEGADDV